MGEAELELTRTIRAPIADVFDRLADVEGHDAWMPHKGSIRRASRQTSSGPTGVGTTYEDSTLFGKAPGEVVTFDRPERLVYHWWQKAPWGAVLAEGWPGYTLEAVGERETLVRHHARLRTYGIYGPATAVMKRIALRERTVVLDALEASFREA
ncbi:uncharacterized protein YndB with AHSA1/START domain [Nocardioides sp. BE266]|uniref:SRPBCC family protein n=1 Tax=Nocardioides sp. BE266 TaxID=2817725 RepID=UPI0028613848|nr:SRPBCC family protein [Nocardioides sp. BE266]MDR7254701.1 uncharacterized protein YndB with AHSA1/START domain [Nocardioides sp. BE266]